jgi:hypothetical protein
MLNFPRAHFSAVVLAAGLVLTTGCRSFTSVKPLDRKTARKLTHEMTVASPWIRIPAGLGAAAEQNPKALRAYKKLASSGVLNCDADFTECAVGPKGKDLIHEGSVGIKVTIGFLVADEISVIRLVDGNSANASVTLRFQPTAVFSGFRSELTAILEAQGDAFAFDQISGGHVATALFHRSNDGWHLESLELLERTGSAVRKVSTSGAMPPAQTTTNLAESATVLVSSEETSAGQSGSKAIDGLVDGSPNDSQTEWVTRGEREGAWIKLTWSAPVRVWEVVLHDRPNPADNIRSGTLTFSDGSIVNVGALPIYGAPLHVEFNPRVIAWVQFRVTSAEGTSTGLAEIEVLGAPVKEGDVSGLR